MIVYHHLAGSHFMDYDCFVTERRKEKIKQFRVSYTNTVRLYLCRLFCIKKNLQMAVVYNNQLNLIYFIIFDVLCQRVSSVCGAHLGVFAPATGNIAVFEEIWRNSKPLAILCPI